MKQVLSITRKEIKGYFGSPMALIFLGAFLAAILFSFFWVDTFFARGIADVRPLFRSMPVLMIFLVAALTMRQWSEEQRSGTLEVLLTLPVSLIQLVVGKFLAVMSLVALSLALTIFLPLSVSMLGNLDWGPVLGGYLASLLLAAAYASIGLFLSSRTNNQIVSLISTVMVCGLFYLAGSSGVIDFVGDAVGGILRAVGSGSRFESIQRGVVDLRDLLYYLSLTAIFLSLNVASLDSKKWGSGERTLRHRRRVIIGTVLVVLNLVLVNVWVFPLRRLRLDLTEEKEYSLSQTTRDLLANLQEPLLIRGYFSGKTHPLLAPLVPRITDMLREYEIASGGMVELEITDPTKNPEKEAEANQTYGIRPMPFQVAGRYETSIINSYFDILIRYGDQNVVLNFADLIEVEPHRDGTVDVRLRNLEYDLTRSVKKVVFGFQSVDTLLAALDKPVDLTIYITPNTLPESLADAPTIIEKVVQDIAAESAGKFRYKMVDPDAPGGTVTRQELYETYGIQPIAVSFFSSESYYLSMVLRIGDQDRVIYPSGEMTDADVRGAIEAALKRSSPGFLKVVGLWTPRPVPTQDMYGQTQNPLSSWNKIGEALRQEYEVRNQDLSTGWVSADVDVLVVVAPQDMTDKERFAIDQYLMRGGSVVVAAGNYGIEVDQVGGGLALKPLEANLREMLSSYGINVEQSLVMDPQNEPFPVQVTRKAGGIQIREIQAIEYPFFVDVRSDGMNTESPIVFNIPAVTLNWVSPITIDESKTEEQRVTTLLQSSADSWTQTDTAIQPDFDTYPGIGFPTGGEKKARTLAVSVQGVFESAFKNKPSPLLESETEGKTAQESGLGIIESSPETARLVVFSSGEFMDDVVFNISSSFSRDRYLNSLKLIQNAVAWSTEDQDLLSIRSRGTFARVLVPMTERRQSLWEIGNYVVALLALVVVGLVWDARRRNEQPMELLSPEAVATSKQEVA